MTNSKPWNMTSCWQELAFDSPGGGKDCGLCAHLACVKDRVDGDRRLFHWGRRLGYQILEFGRVTERIMLSPPECESWTRFYPGPGR